ncbi:MAG: hypothetical protein RLZZ15_617 [Verrucomicrobiota bacterium]|jgi:hypothetical protein
MKSKTSRKALALFLVLAFAGALLAAATGVALPAALALEIFLAAYVAAFFALLAFADYGRDRTRDRIGAAASVRVPLLRRARLAYAA